MTIHNGFQDRRRALVQPVSFTDVLQSAIADHQAGRIAAAETGYRRILASHPDQFDALHLLGVLHHQRGQHREAIELIRRAVAQEPLAYPAFHNLGLAHVALDELDAARACFERAVALNPDYVDAYENLAAIFLRQGNVQEELRAFQQVAARRPDRAGAQNNLGTALHRAGQYEAAGQCFEKALALDPQLASAAFNMGELKRTLGRHTEAVPYLRRAIELRPDFAEAHYSVGIVSQALGLHDDALQELRTALSLNAEYLEARWALAMAQLPLVHGSEESPLRSRAAFARELEQLDTWFAGARVHQGFKVVGGLQPFYLAYHDGNHAELLSKYGDLSARLMQQWQADQRLVVPKHNQVGAIKLGIVSGQVFDQSVWTAIIRGFCEDIDRERVSLHIFYTGIVEDRETAVARSLASSFVQGLKSLRQWVDAIGQADPDVIMYPEIGMDQMTTRLASLRLAPLQIASWGHPITTGLPTIDMFLSAQAFEPKGARQHYRERLITLPNLGCCYRSLAVISENPNVAQWGIDPETPLLFCAGTPYKYMPQHDRIYVEIARRLGRAKFIFFTDMRERLSQLTHLRLECAFRDAGLDPRSFLTLVPRQSRPAFFGLMERADVYLDTIGFSGFNTAMQAIECGLPVVTQRGRFMRGRLASGILDRMGMSDLVADTDAAYVDRAVRLCQDASWRADIRRRIAEARHVLFGDEAPVRALEDLLKVSVGR